MSHASPAEPPRQVDVLVVGGGPGGTAAAFRACELGLSTLVIDYDDLMKRIRDYAKDKLILPSFGGGDAMCFPRGAAMLDDLRFAPIDKDEMCARWKGLYQRHGVETRIGIELTGLRRTADGRWAAEAWDHAQRGDFAVRARHVVLAIGRGVPRRFDIPGDTDGIAFKLNDPTAYVGAPACVIGGGTSAAEAVIALSGAKAAAGDPSAVYWAYRGDKMPRVSKALAEVFFEAYVGNGNIRYFPRSEPSAVVTGDDRREYLAVRIDRRRMDGRPAETSHLEFPKAACIACIGEDIPESLLDAIGIPMAVGGPHARKRMVVNRYLESVQPNVYLVGDILSQAHFQTADFDADPATFREVKHRGNIKSALRDGVLVANVIRQREDGCSEIDIAIEDADELEQAGSVSGVIPPRERRDTDQPPAASLGAGRRTRSEAAARLVRILPGGVEAEEYPLDANGVLTLGRAGCDASFPDDTLLSPRHASVSSTPEGTFLRDDGSETGVFLRVPASRKLTLGAGDLVRAGRQFLLFAGQPGAWSVTHFDSGGAERGQHQLAEGTIVLGRQAPDLTLDPDDGTLSRRQLAITVRDGALQIKDLKSVNGSYLRVRGATGLEHGDQIRVGQQRLQFSSSADAVLDEGYRSAAIVLPSAAPPPAPDAPVAPVAAGSPAITFRGLGKTLPAAPGQTVCEVAEAAGLTINAECHAGICGSDPIRIVAGAEHLASAADDEERDTLADICGLSGDDCRLACKVRITGPVEVEIL